jgi:hypothetical protein
LEERGHKKGPDWRFMSCGMTINLEVKYRPGQWMRKVDGPVYFQVKQGLFDGIAEKFPYPSTQTELNIAGIVTRLLLIGVCARRLNDSSV